jgi:CheY-like chemotaxis protein
MPEMNGQEFYRAAVAVRPQLSQRIVFLTGDLLCNETRSFLEKTGAASIAKPFRLSSIEQTITDVLNADVITE